LNNYNIFYLKELNDLSEYNYSFIEEDSILVIVIDIYTEINNYIFGNLKTSELIINKNGYLVILFLLSFGKFNIINNIIYFISYNFIE